MGNARLMGPAVVRSPVASVTMPPPRHPDGDGASP